MNIFKKAAVAAMVVVGAAVPTGMALASGASAQGLTQINSTQVLVGASWVAPNVASYTYNEYQPSVNAPGFTRVASVSELCLVGPAGTICNWRLTSATNPVNQLVGNSVHGPKGTAGAITSGRGLWSHAKGIERATNIAPNVSNSSFIFSTP